MSSVRWFHLTATVHPALIPLSGEDIGGWLWAHLRDAFPTALATVLMPDHPHLVIPTEDAEAAAARLARLLGQLGRRLGVLGRAGRVAAPEPIRSVATLARHVRYVALNPCRAGFASCPLAWPWSTHRDVVGACLDPWVTASRLALALQTTPIGFAARHHGYVSADPHVNVEGTPLPRPAATT